MLKSIVDLAVMPYQTFQLHHQTFLINLMNFLKNYNQLSTFIKICFKELWIYL